ncbi:MAG TPA: hypothetical protein VGC58_00425, partial [Candidatus Paceibacterota bacterium]
MIKIFLLVGVLLLWFILAVYQLGFQVKYGSSEWNFVAIVYALVLLFCLHSVRWYVRDSRRMKQINTDYQKAVATERLHRREAKESSYSYNRVNYIKNRLAEHNAGHAYLMEVAEILGGHELTLTCCTRGIDRVVTIKVRPGDEIKRHQIYMESGGFFHSSKLKQIDEFIDHVKHCMETP